MKAAWIGSVALMLALGCGGGSSNDGADAAPGEPDAGGTDPTSVLVNESTDLHEVLQTAEGKAACDAWLAKTDRSEETKLLCGKWLFFYETFGTEGLPLELGKWMMRYFPDSFGEGMSSLGMFPNPDDADGLPVGLARGPSPSGGPDVAAFTCGSCHFGRTPDGRYVVGLPNLDYEYGLQFASFVAVGKMIIDPDSPDIIDPIKERLAAEIAAVRANQEAMAELGAIIGELGGDGGGGLDVSLEVQQQYYSWKRGTMDFLIVPILDDGVHTVSRILPLWGLLPYDEAVAAGMPHQMLSWTGLTRTLEGFVEGFALLSYGDEDVQELAEPLAAFVLSLRPPAIDPAELDAAAVERGRTLFSDAGCTDCHDGPSYESTRTYPFDEIGTDDAMADIFSPSEDGTLCCGFSSGGDTATRQIKSPRLTGVWALDLFLHNGAVDGLENLFCLNGSRPTIEETIFSDRGHDMTCHESLSEQDRRDLIEFLRSL